MYSEAEKKKRVPGFKATKEWIITKLGVKATGDFKANRLKE